MPDLRKTRLEVKSDITSQAAWAIVEREAANRNAKTARLRAARLALEPISLAAKRKLKGKES